MEKIVVSVRVRPLHAREQAGGAAWDVVGHNTIVPKVGPHAPPVSPDTHSVECQNCLPKNVRVAQIPFCTFWNSA
jgi:hypothetical protein